MSHAPRISGCDQLAAIKKRHRRSQGIDVHPKCRDENECDRFGRLRFKNFGMNDDVYYVKLR